MIDRRVCLDPLSLAVKQGNLGALDQVRVFSTRQFDEIDSFLSRHGIIWKKIEEQVEYQGRAISVYAWALCRRDGSQIVGGLRAALEEIKHQTD